MFFGLGDLFRRWMKKPEATSAPARTTAPAADPPAAALPTAPGTSAFIRRDAVFDRKSRLIGHVYRLQHRDAGLANSPTRRQLPLDDALLKSLTASSDPTGWGQTLAFIPLSSASLGHRLIEHLPPQNTVLLLVLAPEDEDPQALSERLQALGERGLRFGVFRQPRHPAFAAVLERSSFAALDVAESQGGNVRDFSIALRGRDRQTPIDLLATHIETADDHLLCRQCHFHFFHGPYFKAEAAGNNEPLQRSDPHKLHLMNLMNLVQGEAETAEIALAMKQDPLLTFRILRYLNSPAIGLTREINSIDQALMVLGRQRLSRWISVLLFSVRDPDFADWLVVESALGRGRVMELLGSQRLPAAEADHLFLTGIFSSIDKLLRVPLPEALESLRLPANIRNALLERSGPFAPLLAVAEACEAFDPARIETAARTAGLEPETVNRALLSATAWASDQTAHWE